MSEQLVSMENDLSLEKGKVSELNKKLMVAEDEVRRLQENQNGLLDIERKRHKGSLN